MRLAFAVATHVDPEILIVDEMLAVGDDHFQRKSMAKMTEFKAAGKTIILVTHDLSTVSRWCDLAAWIDGGVTRMVGTPSKVIDAYKQAVQIAETTQSGALTEPGRALPALPDPVRPDPTGWLRAVRLLDAQGREVDQLAHDAQLDVCLDFETPPGIPIACTVMLVTQYGTNVFSTTHEPGLSPGKGTARLTVSRLGLGEGPWTVKTCVHPPGEKPLTYDVPLLITPESPGTGAMRPPHAWRMEGAGAAASPQAPLATAGSSTSSPAA